MEQDEGTIASILNVLRFKHKGLTITEISKKTSINRNSVAKYLQILMVSGQVEMQSVGNAKVYSISRRIPYSSVLNISSDFIVVIDGNQRIIDVNEPFLAFSGLSRENVLRHTLREVDLPLLADPGIAPLIREGLEGSEGTGEIRFGSGDEIRYFRVKCMPTVFDYGEHGLTAIIEDITEQQRAVELTRKSEEKFRHITERCFDVVFLMNLTGTITFVSPSITRMAGYSPGEVVGTDFRRYLAEHEASMLAQKINPANEQEVFEGISVGIRRKDGSWVDAEINLSPVVEGGRVTGRQGIIRDLTERVAAQEAQSLLASLVESSDDAIIGKDLEKTIISWNSGAERLFGYRVDEVIGRPISFLVPDEHLAGIEKVHDHLMHGGHIVHFESVNRKKDGTCFDASITISPIYDPHGTILGASTIVRDITGKKRAERALRESEETTRALLDATTDSAILLDLDTRIRVINDHAVRCLKKHGVDVKIGDSISDIFPPDVARQREEMCQKAIRTGTAAELEDELNGRRYLTRFNPVFGADGEVTAVAAYNRDITEMRRNEEELRRGEETAKALLNASNEAALLIDTAGRILTANEHAFAALARYGGGAVKTESDVIGKSFHELVPAELAAVRDRKRMELIATGEPVQYTEEYGGRILKNTLSPIRGASGGVDKIAVFSRDFTEKRRMKREIGEKNQQMHDIIEFLPDATFVIDTDGQIIAWNRAMEVLSGVSKEDMLGKRDYAYTVPFYAERRPALVDLVSEPEEVLRSFYPNAARDKDSIRASVYCPELNTGMGAYLWVNASPLYNSDGEITGGIESVRDISPQMIMEKQIVTQRDLGIELVSVTSIEEAARISLSTAMSVAAMDAGGIQLIDPDTKELVLVRGENISGEFRQFVERMPAQSWHTLHVLTGVSTFYPTGGRYNAEMEQALVREGLRSVATVPITHLGSVIGALHVASWKHDAFSPSTQKTLETIAVLAGNTIGRIRSDRAILQYENRLNIAIHGAGIGVWELDLRSGRVSLDEHMRNLYGYLPQDLLEDKKALLEIVHPEDRDTFLTSYHDCITGRSPSFQAEVRIRRKDGEWIWTRNFGMAIERDADGSPVSFMGMTQNIGPMKAAEKTIRESERILDTIINSIPDMVYFKDEHGRLAVVNSACVQLLGLSEQDLIGKRNRDLLPEKLAAQCDRSDHAAVSSGKMERCLERMAHGNGNTFILDTIKVPLFNDDGTLRGLLGVSRDITSFVEKEEYLEQIEKKCLSLFMHANDAIFRYEITEHGLPGRILEVNPAACRMLGYAPEELTRMTMGDLFSPELSPADGHALARRREDEEQGVLERVLGRKDGGEVPVEIATSLIEFNGDETILSIVRDISDVRKTGDRVRRYIGNLDFLSRTGAECVRLSPGRDVVGYIAEELHTLLPDAVIACASRHNGSSRFVIRAVEGTGSFEALLVSLLGEHPLGMILSPDDTLRDLLKDGELVRISADLVGLCGPEFADHLYPAVMGALRRGSCSAIGIAGDDQLFGIVFIFDSGGGMSEEASIIETFVGQAARVLQKRHVERLIRTSYEDLEEKVQERTRDLIRANEMLSMEIIGHKYAMKDSRFQRALAEECFNRQECAAFGVDEEGRIILASRGACELLGYTRGELRGRVWIDEIVAPVSRSEALRISTALIGGNAVNSSSFRGSLLTRDGDERTQRWHAQVLVDERGSHAGVLWTGGGAPEG